MEVSPEKGQGVLMDLEEFLLGFLSAGRDAAPLRQGDVVAFRQVFDGLGKAHALPFHDQGEDVASRAAAEAMVKLLIRVQGEGRIAFRVKRAESHVFGTALVERGVLRGDL